MALKTFIIYFSPFFVAAIALYALLKKYVSSFAAMGKKPLVYGVLFSFLSGAITFAIVYFSYTLFEVFWIWSALYVLLGILHIQWTHKRFFNHPKESANKLFYAELLYTLMVSFMILVVFAVLQYFLQDKSFLFYPTVLSLLFFFIPLLLSNTFKAAYAIPPTRFATWQYPLMNAPELPNESEGERLYVIGFEISKKEKDFNRTFFRAKAPEEMLLGELYYHFINDYNELQSETPIQFVDDQGKPQSWYFRTKPKWHQRSRILDANKSVQHNGIRENTVIICERNLDVT